MLRAFFKTNEIITSLMLNYVAAYLLTYLIFNSKSYWRETKGFNATRLPDRRRRCRTRRSGPARRSTLRGGIALPLGAGIAVLVAVVLWVLYSRTRFGFEAQVLGDSPRAARYAGMRTRRKILAVMAISGAIAGLGGASQVGDFRHTLDADPNGLQKQDYGYTGHRRRGARPLQPVRRRARRVPDRRARRTPATRCRAPTSRPGSSA